MLLLLLFCQFDVVSLMMQYTPSPLLTLPNLPDASSAQSMGIDMHLERMVELLCQEEEERDPKDPGSMVGGECRRGGTCWVESVGVKSAGGSTVDGRNLFSTSCMMGSVLVSPARVLVWSLCCNIRYWTLSTPLGRVM